MNDLDQFMKYELRVRHYIRYADDFVILSDNKEWPEDLALYIRPFLFERLALQLRPNKIFIKAMFSGVDFLGWVLFPDHRVLRTTTKRRMLKRIKENPEPETINSYLGLLKHGNGYKIQKENDLIL